MGVGIDPAGVNAARQAVGDLAVDQAAEFGQAAETGLDVAAGATEAIIEVEVAQGRVEIVEPHQADEASAKPDTFRISRRSVDDLGGLGKFIGAFLAVAGGFGGGCSGIGWRLPALILGPQIAALGNGCSNSDQQGCPWHGDAMKQTVSQLKQQATHKVPDGPVGLICPEPNGI